MTEFRGPFRKEPRREFLKLIGLAAAGVASEATGLTHVVHGLEQFFKDRFKEKLVRVPYKGSEGPVEIEMRGIINHQTNRSERPFARTNPFNIYDDGNIVSEEQLKAMGLDTKHLKAIPVGASTYIGQGEELVGNKAGKTTNEIHPGRYYRDPETGIYYGLWFVLVKDGKVDGEVEVVKIDGNPLFVSGNQARIA